MSSPTAHPPLSNSPPLSCEVVLCTYNGASWIGVQVASILTQTRQVQRISVFDDGSNDGTVAAVEAIASELQVAGGPEFCIHRNVVNLGYAANFAQGLAAARYDVVFLCDQDDIWEVGKVARLMERFEQPGFGVDLVFSDGLPVDQHNRPLPGPTVLQGYGLRGVRRLAFERDAFGELLRRNYVNGAACAVRRTLAQTALPVPGGWPHDHWLAIWAALHGGLAVVDECLYRYRQHQSNSIGLGSDRNLYRYLGIWRQPQKPRLREQRMCLQIEERLGLISDRSDMVYLRARSQALAKIAWLADVLNPHASLPVRIRSMLRSALVGHYGRFSPEDALMRDLVGLIRPDR